MTNAFHRPQTNQQFGTIEEGINKCCIRSFIEVTNKATEDYAFEIELGFENTTWTRKLRNGFAFSRLQENGELDLECKHLRRFYRFLDFLALPNPIGLNELGDFINIKGEIIHDYEKAIGEQLRYDTFDYDCFIENDEWNGKKIQRVRHLVDRTNEVQKKSFEGLIRFIKNNPRKKRQNSAFTPVHTQEDTLPE